MKSEIIIDDKQKWKAVIQFFDGGAALRFYTKPVGNLVGEPIQGRVDDTLGYGERKIGIGDLKLEADDGSFNIYFDSKQPRQPIVDYLAKLYNDNKKKFVKNITRDIKDYEKSELDNLAICQSCGGYICECRAPGTNKDGSKNSDYCINCYKGGSFTENLTAEQMAARKTQKVGFSSAEERGKFARAVILPDLLKLKRWKK